jgi:DNA-binding NtrC family response regulator
MIGHEGQRMRTTCKVLIVETRDDLRELLASVAGAIYETHAVANQIEMCAALTSEHYSIVLVNLEEPGVDPLAMADEAARHGCEVIIIPNTPAEYGATVRSGYRALRKPFRNTALLALLSECCDRISMVGQPVETVGTPKGVPAGTRTRSPYSRASVTKTRGGSRRSAGSSPSTG